MGQVDLTVDANVSARHLSFIETGRSRPSAEMIVHLAEHRHRGMVAGNRARAADG